MISYMEKPRGKDGGIAYGIFLVVLYVFCTISSKLISEQASYKQGLIGTKAYGAIVSTIYSKILRVSPATNKEFTQGQIINFIQVDSEKVSQVAFVFPGVAKLPFQLIFALVYLFYYFGVYIFIALGVCLVIVFINFFFAVINAKFQEKVLSLKDNRMKTTTEIISNVKVIKLNCWTKYFLAKVLNWRNKELSTFKYTLILNSIEIFNFVILIPMLTLITFLVFIRSGHEMSLSDAFMAITVLHGLQEPVQWIPEFLGYFMEFVVSMKRINKFLLCDEINPKIVTYDDSDIKNNLIDILINDSNFTWGVKHQDKEDKKSKNENSKAEDKKDNSDKKVTSINENDSSDNYCKYF